MTMTQLSHLLLPLRSQELNLKPVGWLWGFPTVRFDVHRHGSMAAFLGLLPHER